MSEYAGGISQSQFDGLGMRMDKGLAEIKDILNRFDERLRMQETNLAGSQPLLIARVDAAWRKIDEMDAEQAQMRQAMALQNETIQQLSQTINRLEAVAKWILGIITALIVAVLVAYVTGQIDIHRLGG